MATVASEDGPLKSVRVLDVTRFYSDPFSTPMHPTETLAGDVIGAGLPIKLNRTHKGYTDPAPALGQDNTDIYSGLLGLSAGQIAELSNRQVI